MATFYVIRFRRTFMASDRFGHIEKGSRHDYVLFQEGAYKGTTTKTFNSPFDNAEIMTEKQLRETIADWSEYPNDIYETFPLEIQAPA